VLLSIVHYAFLLCTRTTLTSPASLGSLFTWVDIARSGKHVCTPLHSLHSAAALVGGSNVTFTLSFLYFKHFYHLVSFKHFHVLSLLNICLFPFLNKSHAETKVIMFGVNLPLIPKIEIALEDWFLQDIGTNYRPSSMELWQMLVLCWREMQEMTSLDAE